MGASNVLIAAMEAMAEEHWSVPDLVEFETNLASSSDDDSSVDKLQSLNTALCFLCSINADVSEVERFLTTHPQALLLEGTGPIPEESAHTIVKEQMRQCECFSASCNQNRQDVLRVLDKGFAHYQDLNLQEAPPARGQWNEYADQLTRLESEIHRLRQQELTMRQRVLETAITVQSYKTKLQGCSRHSKSGLALLACTTANRHNSNHSDIEYELGVATVSLSSLEREHQAMLREIRQGRRTQFVLLKQAFDGVRRHVCVAKKKHDIPKGAVTNKKNGATMKNERAIIMI